MHISPGSTSTYYTRFSLVPYCTHTTDVFPHVQYFDSVADLAAKLRNTDLRAVSATMHGVALYLPLTSDRLQPPLPSTHNAVHTTTLPLTAY
jgi:hypothetical protein